MKKNWFSGTLVMALVFVLFLAGCTSAPERLSHNGATPENGATLVLKGMAAIRHFDGEIPSGWNAPPKMYNMGSIEIIVPAGQHKFLLTGGTSQKEIDMVLEAGHTYEAEGSVFDPVTFKDITK
jgi:hypothetical protein